MKLLVVIPGAVSEGRHVEMLRVQSLLAPRLRRHLPGVVVTSALLCDWVVPQFEERVADVGRGFDVFDSRVSHVWGWGVRNPTEAAIQLAFRDGFTHVLRVIQDTVVHDAGKLSESLRSTPEGALGGNLHVWATRGHHALCDEMGLPKTDPLSYINGACMWADRNVWHRYYSRLPNSINHYWDDCMMSLACPSLFDVSASWEHRHDCDAERSRETYASHLSELEGAR